MPGLFVCKTGVHVRALVLERDDLAPVAVAVAFLSQTNEPRIDIVYALDVLGQKVFIRIRADGGFVITLFELSDEVEEFVDLGMHDAQVADDADFVDSERLTFG